MKKVAFSVKIDPALRDAAKIVADDMGVPMTAVLTSLLREFIATRTIYFSDARLSRHRVYEMREYRRRMNELTSMAATDETKVPGLQPLPTTKSLPAVDQH